VDIRSVDLQQDPTGISVSQKIVKRNIFRNKNKTAAILLDPDALTFEITDYSVSEEFSNSFVSALETLNKYRPIEYYDRLGMRMLDAIQPVNGEALESYLIPEVTGFTKALGGNIQHLKSFTESVFKSGDSTLVLKTIRAVNGVHLPPDLSTTQLQIEPRFSEYKGEVIMLDTDSFQDVRRFDFDAEKVKDELSTLKSLNSKSFKAIVTERALARWK
jgi:uncharacterized protein (TIGR04255 family)